MNPRNQSFVVTFLLIVAAVAMIVMAFQRDSGSSDKLTINEVARDIQAGKVVRVVIDSDDSLRVIYTNGSEDGIQSYKEANSTLVQQLLDLGVAYCPTCPAEGPGEVPGTPSFLAPELFAEARFSARTSVTRSQVRPVARPNRVRQARQKQG